MGRWRWAVVLGVVGWLACGPGGLEAPPEPRPVPGTGGTLEPEPPDAGEPLTRPPPDAGVEPGTDGGTSPETPPPDASLVDLGTVRPGEFPPVQPRIPTVLLRVAPEDLQKLEANPLSDDMVPVEMEVDGQRATGLMRFRGASTRTVAQKSYKIELGPGQKLERRENFHLLASYNDSGKLTEKFAVDLFLALGLPVPRARYVTVRVNGVHQGLFLDMEHVGKDYVKARGMEKGAARYRCGHRNCELTLAPGPYQTDFEKKNDEETGRADLDAFLAWVNRGDDADFVERLTRHVELEAYLGNLAADALISNAVIEDSRSYWIHERARGRWTYVPWDLNNARMFFWRTWKVSDPPITTQPPQSFTAYDAFVQTMWETRVAQRPDQRPTWSVLATRVWDRPELRARILAKLEAALHGPFSEAKAHAHIDALWARVRPELEKDPYVSRPHMQEAARFLKTYVSRRRQFLLGQLDTLRSHGGGPLVIREVAPGPGGYVELHNRGPDVLPLERYALTNDLRDPLRHRLPEGLTLGPGKSLRLSALPFTLSREEGGEVGIFDATRVSQAGEPLMYGPEDAVWFGPLPPDTVYGRASPSSEDFERRPAVLP